MAIINGSIERSAKALEGVASEVRDLGVKFDMQIKMAEAARIALATETERRRTELADSANMSDRKFTRREKFVGSAITVALAGLGYHFR